jgi:hypothetical protein
MTQHEIENTLIKEYYCSICDTIHQIKLNKDIIKGKSQFPFPYIFLHGQLKNILTTLYVDKNLEIRGVDVHILTNEDLFSKEQAANIISTLMKEIETLRKENEKLVKEINDMKEKYEK